MALTQVILKEKIKNLGAEADVVKVRRGFARNFLVPQGKAYEATEYNLKHVAALKEARAKREAEEVLEAEKIGSKLKKLKLKLTLATGAAGKAFGSITTIDIVKAINAEAKTDIDRHSILLEKAIKTTGKHDVEVNLGHDVKVTVKLTVVAEGSKEEVEDEGKSEE
jgi:large subunit ribosomal protein L9